MGRLLEERGVLGRDRQTMLFHLEERRTLVGFWKLMRSFNPNRDLIIGHNVFWDIREDAVHPDAEGESFLWVAAVELVDGVKPRAV